MTLFKNNRFYRIIKYGMFVWFICATEINFRIAAAHASHLKIAPLFETEVFHGETLSVFYPASPRVPHHLTIVFHRQDIETIADVTQEENRELFATLKKIAEAYKTVAIQGFVVAFKNEIVEVIPHLPNFHGVKHLVDKFDCNRYVLFPEAPLSPIVYPIEKGKALFWEEAFRKEYPPLEEGDWKISFPYTRQDSHCREARLLAERHLQELLEDRPPVAIPIVPTDPSEIGLVLVSQCIFCNAEVMSRQSVYDYKSVTVAYNIRLGEKPACNFLIFPKRHIEKIYSLTLEEIDDSRIVRKALIEVLREIHPEHKIVLYIQDDPSTGQTVFHSHEQVVSLNPKTIALFWTEQSLRPPLHVSEEEMRYVCEELGRRLREKIERQTEEKSA